MLAALLLCAGTTAEEDEPSPFSYENPYDEPLTFDAPTERLIEEMVDGFVGMIQKESDKWYECGIETPHDQWHSRAETMARHVVASSNEVGMTATPWGLWGVIYKESRGNRCSIGPNPRKYAVRVSIIDEPRNPHLWTEDDVRSVLGHKRWKGRTADLGIGQIVWRRYARLPCEQGSRGCFRENRRWVRVPTLDEMLSVKGGARVAAYGMKTRQNWRARNNIPWIYWPGANANYEYAQAIADIVRQMGGPYHAVLGYHDR